MAFGHKKWLESAIFSHLDWSFKLQPLTLPRL
jgi:hypothetical protein